jgi:hypothetical protein
LRIPAAQPSGFVRAGDLAEVGDEVIFHGDHGTLIRGLVADRAVSPLTQRMMYRVVNFVSEMFEPDSGEWVPHRSSSRSARLTTNDIEPVHTSARGTLGELTVATASARILSRPPDRSVNHR